MYARAQCTKRQVEHACALRREARESGWGRKPGLGKARFDRRFVVLAALLFSGGAFALEPFVVDSPPLDAPAVRDYLADVHRSVRGGSPTVRWTSAGEAFWLDLQGRLWRWREGHPPALLRRSADSGEVELAAAPGPEPVEVAREEDREARWNFIGIVDGGGRAEVDDYERPCAALPSNAVWLVLARDAQRRYLDAQDGTEEARCEQPEASLPRSVRDSFPINGWGFRERPSPDGRWFASLSADDFVIRSRYGSDGEILRAPGSERQRWYFASDIWESSDEGWSPNSRYVVGRQHDTRDVRGIPYLDYLGPGEAVRRFHYWSRAGEPLPHDRFMIFDATSRERRSVELPTLSGEHFDFFIGWAPDSRRFAVLRYARDLRRQTLVFVDAETGRGTTVLEEARDRGWVKWPSGPRGLVFLEDGSGFLWRSNRAGYFHWYLYDAKAREIRRLTQGDFDSGAVIGVDSVRGWLYFQAQSDAAHPHDQHLNRVAFDGTGQTQLTTLRGQHRGQVAPNLRWLVDVHEHIDRPPSTALLNPRSLETVNVAVATVDERFRAKWQAPLEFSVPLRDGHASVDGLVFPPQDFDPQRRYPVIERIYGGMQSSAVRRRYPGVGTAWPGGEYHQLISYLNYLGFVVVTMDAPGTPGRGRANNLATYGSWPEGVAEDHGVALRALMQRYPWMDAERIGIAGNSWGGYLALHSALLSPDRFKAVSASVPETDLIDHVHWIEWQLGLLETNRSHYERYSLLPRIESLSVPLLLTAGTSDVNVPVSNTMKLLDALAQGSKDYELVLFPGTNHAHQGRGDRYAYAVNRMARFFARYLGQPSRE